MSGRIRGLYLTIANMGFMLGPFLSLNLLDMYSFRGIFAVVSVIDITIFVLALYGLRGINHTVHRESSIIALFKKVFRRANIVKIYYISYVLDFFYATMLIYSPMYLKSIGFELQEIGIIFTIMLLPFIFLQYPVGVLADKKMGEKELLVVALSIMCLSVLSIYFISSTSVVVWGLILLMTRVGASMLEILRDSYFYKRIDGEDIELIDFYRTSKSVGYISFSLVSVVLLSFLPIKIVFILLSVIVLTSLYPAFHLVDNKAEVEIEPVQH
jgi:MFS family permease